jgi:hypothetical protein
MYIRVGLWKEDSDARRRIPRPVAARAGQLAMNRRVHATKIAVSELDAIRERVGSANTIVAGLVAAKGAFAGRVDAEMQRELQRVQGHLARVQDELKALAERST